VSLIGRCREFVCIVVKNVDLKVSASNSNSSNSTIVANSKTLAQIFLPQFIQPIDQQYTIRFFTQDKSKKRESIRQFSSPQILRINSTIL
jgi:hypothetical protein